MSVFSLVNLKKGFFWLIFFAYDGHVLAGPIASL